MSYCLKNIKLNFYSALMKFPGCFIIMVRINTTVLGIFFITDYKEDPVKTDIQTRENPEEHNIEETEVHTREDMAENQEDTKEDSQEFGIKIKL